VFPVLYFLRMWWRWISSQTGTISLSTTSTCSLRPHT